MNYFASKSKHDKTTNVHTYALLHRCTFHPYFDSRLSAKMVFHCCSSVVQKTKWRKIFSFQDLHTYFGHVAWPCCFLNEKNALNVYWCINHHSSLSFCFNNSITFTLNYFCKLSALLIYSFTKKKKRNTISSP